MNKEPIYRMGDQVVLTVARPGFAEGSEGVILLLPGEEARDTTVEVEFPGRRYLEVHTSQLRRKPPGS
jgi:hypothetical protein